MATRQEVEEVISRPYGVEFEYGATPADGVLAYLVDWPDCFAAGRTREEAVAELGKAMRDLVAYRLDEGLDIPEPLTSYGGKVLVRMPRTLHRDADVRARREGVSLNQWLTSAISRAIGPAAEAMATTVGDATSLGSPRRRAVAVRSAPLGRGKRSTRKRTARSARSRSRR